MTRFIWWSVIGAGALLVAWSVIADLVLLASGRPTITDYLRHEPWAFWIPAILLLAAMLVLYVHLYVDVDNR
jgi:hypothetical protein